MPRPPEPPGLFVLAGMPRAGTTYLYHALVAHPGFQLPPRKELRFFSHHHSRGAARYESQFGAGMAGAVRADLSPDYFMHPGVAARIASYPGDVRVAIAVREPAPWAVSLHRHLRTFEPDVPDFPGFLRRCRYPDFAWPGSTLPSGTIDLADGFITRRLEEYRQALGERLLLYSFAAFERSPGEAIQALARFAGASGTLPLGALPKARINARTAAPRSRLSYWLSREPVSALLARAIPRAVLMPLRRRWESQAPAHAAQEDAGDLQLAQGLLAQDRNYVENLFTLGPARLGSGKPYAW